MLVLAVASAASLVITPGVKRLAGRLGLVDEPDADRRVHAAAVPRLGGVAVAAALVVALAAGWMAVGAGWLSGPETGSIGALAAGALVVFAVGVADDALSLTPRVKLLGQVAGALVAVLLGFDISALSVGDGTGLGLGVAGPILTLLWLVGVTNALNLVDGIDGLATTVAVVAGVAAVTSGLLLGHGVVVATGVALVGALLGFLRYNWSPASIFLGDSGSMTAGFLLAGLLLEAARDASGGVYLAVPLTALAFPLLDTTLAIMRRWLRGVPLSKADRRHIHHQLLARGHSHASAVGLVGGLAAVTAAYGLLVRVSPPGVVALVAVVGGILMLGLVLFGADQLSYHEFSVARAVLVSVPRLARITIRRGIEAHDLADSIRRVHSVAELNGLLQRHAQAVGFMGLQVADSPNMTNRELVGWMEREESVWRMDFRVDTGRGVAAEPVWVLRVWGRVDQENLPAQAVRMCQQVLPVLRERLPGLPARLERSRRPATPQATVGS